jgi:hypothetical protein
MLGSIRLTLLLPRPLFLRSMVGAVGIDPKSEVPKVKQDLLAGNERLKFYTPIWEEFWFQFWCQLVCWFGALPGTSWQLATFACDGNGLT